MEDLSLHIKFSFCHCSKKIESIGKMTALTQEEVASHTRTVVQGLEALRNEHNSILSGINSTLASAHHPPDSNVISEKAGILQKSLDQIELGLSEAQVMYSPNLRECGFEKAEAH